MEGRCDCCRAPALVWYKQLEKENQLGFPFPSVKVMAAMKVTRAVHGGRQNGERRVNGTDKENEDSGRSAHVICVKHSTIQTRLSWK